MSERCLHCKRPLMDRFKIKFCSNQCQFDDKYAVFLKKWKTGSVSGGIGITTRTLSGHVRRFLFEKYGEKCSLCSWDKKHSITGKVPLEIDHIDGNSENNVEANLRMICPNCHSLTPHFRNLNKGNGRKWRLKKHDE